jgi:hypothetical protein
LDCDGRLGTEKVRLPRRRAQGRARVRPSRRREGCGSRCSD